MPPVQQHIFPTSDDPVAQTDCGAIIPSASTAIRMPTKILNLIATFQQIQHQPAISSSGIVPVLINRERKNQESLSTTTIAIQNRSLAVNSPRSATGYLQEKPSFLMSLEAVRKVDLAKKGADVAA